MDDRTRYQTSHVADTIGVSVSTVRRLCARYAFALSEDATPQSGGRRQFTAEDIAVLHEANRLTLAGLEEEEIAQRLAQSVTLPAQAVTEQTDRPSQLPTLSFDTTALENAVQRLSTAQEEQAAALVRLASAQEEDTAERRRQGDIDLAHIEALQLQAQAMDRLADRLVWIVIALVAIVLITVAVAAGWI